MDRQPSKNIELRQSIANGYQPASRPKKTSTVIHPRLKYLVFGLLASLTILITLLVIYVDTLPSIVDGIARCLGFEEKQFAVVVDAGSTGTRVLVYEFHLGFTNGDPILDDEFFKEVKPGLASYADKPSQAAAVIVDMINDAKIYIPKELWPKTPFVVKATAGLRLLDSVKAENLLIAVREVLQTSGFLVPHNAVEIMDGTDEGIFAWFTVNFLMKRLIGRNTVAALDLGGGSTQVTFVPKDPNLTPSLKDYMHTVPTGNGHVEVFTHSYLNLGIMAVRHAVLSNGFASNETILRSECVNPLVHNTLWNYGNVEYSVSGKENEKSTPDRPVVDLERCQRIIHQIITPLLNPRPVTLKELENAAFSYYFERGFETGLIKSRRNGEIEVNDFKRKAEEICASPDTEQPFMCLDVSYIAMLLEEGFGLFPTTKVKLYTNIDNHAISWALGCAYNLLTKHTDK